MKKLFKFICGAVFSAMLICLFCITANAFSEKEYNEEIEAANYIPINETVYATYDSSRYIDRDYFKFTLPEDGTISVTMNHAYRSYMSYMHFSLSLDGEAKNIIFSYNFPWSAETSTSNRIGLRAGTYYLISWFGADNEDIPYQFTLNYTPDKRFELEPNESLKSATEMPVNVEFHGMTKMNDNDFYAFSIPNDGVVSFTFKQPYNDRDFNTSMQLMAYDGTAETQYENYYFGSASETKTTQKIGLKAGKYYLNISNPSYLGSTSSFEYSIKVNFEQSDNWEKEKNENLKAATSMAIGEKYFGTISRGDLDFYEFSLPENSAISIRFSHQYYDDSFKAVMEILAYDGTSETAIGNYNFINSSESTLTEKLRLDAGTYIIKLETDRYDSYEYNFVVESDKSTEEKTYENISETINDIVEEKNTQLLTEVLSPEKSKIDFIPIALIAIGVCGIIVFIVIVKKRV